LLGDPAVEGPGEDAAGIQSQSKRLALLAYLAVQGGFVRRDVLVEMFWPDSDADKARRALSQATHILRRSLGRSVIRSRGTEELGISPDHAWIDVRSFEAAIAGGRWAEAVKLHRDELLRGLNGDQVSAEFSRWLDAERLRLQRSAAGAAKKLADAAFRNGDVADAISWARRAVAVRPTDEAMFRDYIALLDESGDAALALSEYESFRSRLVSEYDLEPARETVRLIEMIRSRRPEAVPAVRTPESAIDTVPDFPVVPRAEVVLSQPSRVPVATAAGRRLPRALRLGLALVPLLLIGWLTWDLVRAAPDGDARSIMVPNRIAILYFEPVGPNADDAEHIANSLTGAIASYLHSYSSLRVVPLTAVEEFKGKSISHDSLRSVLRASMYLFGQVAMAKDSSVTVTIELADDNRELIWRNDVRFDVPDLVTMEDSLISEITAQASQIGAAIEQRELRRGTSSDVAYSLISRGITLVERFEDEVAKGQWDLGGSLLKAADSMLVEATEVDRSGSRAYLELARMTSKLGFYCGLTGACSPHEEFQRGLAYIDQMIRRGVKEQALLADALETRASLHWQLWIHGTGNDSDTTFLSQASEDVFAAIAVREQSPRAYSLASQIYAEAGEYDKSLTSALDALKWDEFLTREMLILNNVFDAAFNVHNDTIAEQYCARLSRVQPFGIRSFECRMQMAAWTEAVTADVDEAWSQLAEFRQRSKAQYEQMPVQSGLLVAMVIAAAAETQPELADSARRVTGRLLATYYESRREGRESLVHAAAVHARLNDVDRANELLMEYLSNGVRAKLHVRNRRWFDGVVITDLNDRPVGGE
jgi:DNA-binding SARP family transcriptional activator/TolB-like protein